jgi:bifunctional DNA-binding transcriptional regulator/antitoxin component of YhaV-PrlF toxin-antitoxin module
MAKLKESKATYAVEPITVVTARGTTEIPRALRQRYRVTAKSRLRWVDTGQGLLVVPVDQPVAPKNGKQRSAKKTIAVQSLKTVEITRPENLEAIRILQEWMQEPDDWTAEQWNEFEHELRTRRLRFRDIEI